MFRSLLAALLVLALIPAVAAANTPAWRAAASWIARPSARPSTAHSTRPRPANTSRSSWPLPCSSPHQGRRTQPPDPRPARRPVGGRSRRGDHPGPEPRIEAALDHPGIAAARLRLVEAAHDTLTGLDDADSTVRIEDDTLVVNGADLLQAALDAVEPRFPAGRREHPDGATVDIELASSPALAATGVVLPTVDRLATILPLVAIATALLVIVIAHRRARALAVVGMAIAVAGAVCLGLVWFGGETAAAAESPVSPTLVHATYDALSADLVTQSLVLVAVGVALVLLGTVLRALTPSRRPFDDRRDPLPNPDAHRREAVAPAGPA